MVRVVKDKQGRGKGGNADEWIGGERGGRRGGGNDISSEEGERGVGGEKGQGGGGGEGVHVKHVQIDTGKTWREGIIRWFPR